VHSLQGRFVAQHLGILVLTLSKWSRSAMVIPFAGGASSLTMAQRLGRVAYFETSEA
jgi:hypothetical protein